MRVATFATEFDLPIMLIKPSSPTNQLRDSIGSFAHHCLDDFVVAKITTSDQRVCNMIIEPVLRIPDACDPTLSIRAVRLLQLIFGQNQCSKRRVNLVCCSKSSKPAANDQYVGKVMTELLRGDRSQIPWSPGGPRPKKWLVGDGVSVHREKGWRDDHLQP